jgi:hypothetical protein
MATLFLRHNGMSQSEREAIGPVRVFPHVGFAVVGFILWIVYAITDNDTAAWLAVAGIGIAFLIAGTFLITRDQHRRRELASLQVGSGAAAGVAGNAPGAARRVPAESYIPIWLASGHGLLGAATLLLVLLERAGVGTGS